MAANVSALTTLDARRHEQTPQALARITVVALFVGLWVILWAARIPMPVPFLLTLVAEIAFFLCYWRLVFLLPNPKSIEFAHYGMLAIEIIFHTTIVYFLGGISWLGPFAYVFGLVFTNTFVDIRKAFVYTAGATAAFSSLVILEATGVIPHYVYLDQGSLRYSDPQFVVTTLVGGTGVFFSIYLWINWVGRQLRRERDAAVQMQDALVGARRDLEKTNERLETRVEERTALLEFTNAALQDSQRRLRTVVDNAPIVLFAVDKKGVFTIAEGRALEDLGTQPEAIIGRSVEELFPAEEPAQQAVTKALGGEASTVTIGNNTKLEVQLAPLFGGGDTIEGAIGIALDITERTRTAALISGQRRVLEMIARGESLEEVLEALVDVLESQTRGGVCGICLLNADRTKLLPVAGRNLPDAFLKNVAAGVPIGPSSGSCGTAAYRARPVFVTDIATDPLWEKSRDVALENDIRACWSTPIFSRSGQVLGTFAIYHRTPREPDERTSNLVDAATRIAGIAIERANAEAALQESEALLKATVESTADGILVVNSEGRVIYSNDNFARMWRIPAKLLETRDDDQLIRYVLDQLADPESFQAKVHELYGSSREDWDVLSFNDGRVFERFSRPLLKGEEVAGRVWSFRDITERSKSEQALRESESKFRTMAETVSAATFIYQGTRMKYVNSTAERLTGYSREELLSMDFWEVIHPDQQQQIRQRGMARQAGDDVPHGYEVELLTKTGDRCWVDFTAGTIDFEGEPAVLGTAFDITERKKAEKALQAAADRDSLTGLLNRRAGLEAIEERLDHARNNGGKLAVFVLDLDKFKQINDSFSHETGDAALIQFAGVMKHLVGDQGLICRMGGDEFQIALDNAGPGQAFEFAYRIQQELARSLEQSDAELRPNFTVSIGIACYPEDGSSILVLGRRADRAMYAAKAIGPNHTRSWHQLADEAA